MLLMVAENFATKNFHSTYTGNETQNRLAGSRCTTGINSIPHYNSSWSCSAPNMKWLLLIVAENFVAKNFHTTYRGNVTQIGKQEVGV